MSKYSVIVNEMVTNAHGQNYGTQSDRLVEYGSFISPNVGTTKENVLNEIKRVVGGRYS